MRSLSLSELLSLQQRCWPVQQPSSLLPGEGQQLRTTVLAANFKHVKVQKDAIPHGIALPGQLGRASHQL